MAERRSGAAARVALKVGAGDWVDHDAAVARTALQAEHPLTTVTRQLPGGAEVMLPLLIRTGRVSWQCVRTVAADRQLAPAGQQTGEVRIRPQGAGTGMPETTAPVVIATELTISNAQLCIWTVTLTVAGTVTRTVQT